MRGTVNLLKFPLEISAANKSLKSEFAFYMSDERTILVSYWNWQVSKQPIGSEHDWRTEVGSWSDFEADNFVAYAA